MTDELDERTRNFHEIIRRMTEQSIGEERPTGQSYQFYDGDRFDRWNKADHQERMEKAAPKPEPKPADVVDGQWLNNKIGGLILQIVGPAIDRIAERVNAALDDEHKAHMALEDRVREAEIKATQQELELAKRDVEITKQAIAIADLERRLATSDRRGNVIDQPSSLKSIN